MGHQSRLASPGDFFLVEIGNESIIVMADQAGKARAFYNVCRHRGTRLLTQQNGQCKGIKCPYHAWTYAIDGNLLAAPTMDQTPGFDKKDYPLNQVKLQTWNGFLFLCLDDEVQDIDAFYAGFPDLSHLNLNHLVRVGAHDYTVNANWKLVTENYNECYHCPGAHPQLHKLSTERNFPGHNHMGDNFAGGPMGIKSQYDSLTTTGLSNRGFLTGWKESEKNMIFYFCIYPNLYLSIAPDYLMTHYVWPQSSDKVFIQTEWFCSPEQVAQAEFDASNAIEFWDITNNQDWTLCENMMRGVSSKGYQQGRYHWWEEYVHAFDRWYIKKMFG